MITHVVLFKLKDRSSDTIARTVRMLKGLSTKVPQIKGIDVGTDVLMSERSYDISLTVKLGSLKDLELYQTHPEHVKVAQYIATIRESVAVVDYES